MNLVEPPLQNPDDLDGILRAYFRAQMPHPWPAPRVPLSQPDSRRSTHRSRWALAASVGVLIFGSFALPSRVTPENQTTSHPGGPMIGTNDVRRGMDREHKKKEFDKKDHPGFGIGDDGAFPEIDESPIR